VKLVDVCAAILKLIIIIIIKNKKQNVKAPWRGAGA
jgi:hypothetical protein